MHMGFKVSSVEERHRRHRLAGPLHMHRILGIVLGYSPSWDWKEDGMSRGAVTTYHEAGWWKNKLDGTTSASNVHDTKSAAVVVGREMANSYGVDHVIKNADGSIAERNSYPGDLRRV
jgi:hypothetical protein